MSINNTLKEVYAASLESNDDLHPEATNAADDNTGADKAKEVADIETIDETYKETKVPRTDVEVAEKIQKSLEQLTQSVEASLEAGGLDANALALVQLAVEGIADRMGVAPSSVASLEAFEGEEIDRADATRVTLESLKPVTARVGAIVTALKDRIEEE